MFIFFIFMFFYFFIFFFTFCFDFLFLHFFFTNYLQYVTLIGFVCVVCSKCPNLIPHLHNPNVSIYDRCSSPLHTQSSPASDLEDCISNNRMARLCIQSVSYLAWLLFPVVEKALSLLRYLTKEQCTKLRILNEDLTSTKYFYSYIFIT